MAKMMVMGKFRIFVLFNQFLHFKHQIHKYFSTNNSPNAPFPQSFNKKWNFIGTKTTRQKAQESVFRSWNKTRTHFIVAVDAAHVRHYDAGRGSKFRFDWWRSRTITVSSRDGRTRRIPERTAAASLPPSSACTVRHPGRRRWRRIIPKLRRTPGILVGDVVNGFGVYDSIINVLRCLHCCVFSDTIEECF